MKELNSILSTDFISCEPTKKGKQPLQDNGYLLLTWHIDNSDVETLSIKPIQKLDLTA